MLIRSAFVSIGRFSSTSTIQTFLRYSNTFKMVQNPASSTPTGVPLSESDGPLVWVDCEMTGLDPAKDKLLEIAVVITNGDLEPVDDGINVIIHREKEILDNMNPWCIDQHGRTGLTQACLESTHTVEAVSSQILSYIQKWIPQKHIAHLSGNSVHQDRRFLLQEMPEVVDWLHYRIVGKWSQMTQSCANPHDDPTLAATADVSSIKVLTKRWCPQYAHVAGLGKHRALDDILGSIQELQSYRQNIFLRAARTADDGINLDSK